MRYRIISPFSEFAIRRSEEKTFDRYYYEAEHSDAASELASAEWLVENYHSLKIKLRAVRASVRSIPHSVPLIEEGIMKGFPRVLAIAMEYVDGCSGIISEEGIISFLKNKAREEQLTLDELWSFSAVISLVLAKNILTAASRRLNDLMKTEAALKNVSSVKLTQKKLGDVVDTGNAPALTAFVRDVQNMDDNGEKIRWLDKELSELELTEHDIAELSGKIESNTAVTVRNYITGLMAVETFDWENIVSSISVVDEILTNDPDGTFVRMDAKTKNQYRRRVAYLAAKKHCSEARLAGDAIEKAQEEKKHVGFILFERKTKLLPEILYFMGVYGVMLAVLLILFSTLRDNGTGLFISMICLILSAAPAKSLSLMLVNHIAGKLKKPYEFPRLDFNGTIPEECRTVVVVPAIIPSENEAGRLVAGLEVNYLANRNGSISFVLLGDFTDSDCEKKNDDLSVSAAAVDGIRQLNAKYGKRIFYYIGRKRCYNATQKKYFGWERKRGAILSFNKFLNTGEKTDFISTSGGEEALIGAKYVITLDADTGMPFGSAALLAATMEHPLNRPVYRGESSMVIEGFGILQPAMDTTLTSAGASLFSGIVSGFAGTEPYITGTGEVYQDIFGTGSFGGKGIFDSEIFYRTIEKRFPENAILSHDMLEGAHVRAGFVSDVRFADDVPGGYIQYRKRAHRWMRGDWQLLGYLFPVVRNQNGNFAENRLSVLSRYRIWENLRLTLVEPCIFILLLLGLTEKGALDAATFFIAIFMALPLILDFGEKLRAELFTGAKRRTDARILLRSLGVPVLLADKAFLNADAIARTLCRLVSGKNLLEWQTSGQAEAKSKNTAASYYSVMRAGALSGVVLLCFSVITGRMMIALLSLLFIAAPLMMCAISKKKENETISLPAICEEAVERAAEGAWHYYAEFCTKENNYLPPDNFQEEPFRGTAAGTSPTNIGMMLVSAVCAEKLGLSSKEKAVGLTVKTLRTLSGLEKWNGHPYNWYDVKTKKPMLPLFVSSADNGNLACSLIVLREALKVWKPVLAKDTAMLADESLKMIKTLLDGLDMSLLYDDKKDLLSVGYDAQSGILSVFSYDIFASEARLASYYGIISGKLPPKHWGRLSRITALNGNKVILKSWNGSMFEYLMPQIFLRNYKGSMTYEAARNVVSEQIRYGRRAGEPWGISESGYSVFDGEKNYQYKSFGIPSAAVRYIRSDEYVAAPYASALALMTEPKKAAENLVRFQKEGMCGRFGYYEALDAGRGKVKVRSFMAHHEGMTIASVTNCLYEGYVSELFHSAPEVKAGELLLQERLPVLLPFDALPRKTREKEPEIENGKTIVQRITSPGNVPHCAVMTNGEMSIIVSDSGEIKLFSGETLISKPMTQFIYVKSETSGKIYPLFSRTADCVEFRPDMAVISGRGSLFSYQLGLSLAPDRNALFIMLEISDEGKRDEAYSVVCNITPSLDDEKSAYAHPAYSDVFIDFSYDENRKTAYAKRKSRDNCRRERFAALKAITTDDNTKHFLSRYQVTGRNRTDDMPLLSENDSGYETSGTLALGVTLSVPKQSRKKAEFIFAYAESERTLEETLECYDTEEQIGNAKALQFERAKLMMQYRQIDRKRFAVANALISRLTNQDFFRRKVSYLKRETLWKYGISGDLPIIMYDVTGAPLAGLRLVLSVFDYIVTSGVKADLIIVTHDDGYHRFSYDDVMNTVRNSSRRDLLEKKSGIFIIQSEKAAEDIKNAESFAAVLLKGNEKDIQARLMLQNEKHRQAKTLFFPSRKETVQKKEAIPKLEFFNGTGGFLDGEYHIVLDNGNTTPLPWSNIMANEKFGTLVTESGGGYSWFRNSREFKITKWSNDPVTDMPSEMIYVRDDDSGRIITAKRLLPDNGQFFVTYGKGYSEFRHTEDGLEIKLTEFVPEKESFCGKLVNIRNQTDAERHLSLHYYVSLVLSDGSARTDILARNERARGIVMANRAADGRQGTAFVSASSEILSVITKKSEFFGSKGSIKHPVSLDTPTRRISPQGGPADCIAISVSVVLKPYTTEKTAFLLGAAENDEAIYGYKNDWSYPETLGQLLTATKEKNKTYAGPFSIATKDKSLNTLFNSFLMYQTYVCRYLARTSFYQASGAYGFRDQLQDAMAFLYCNQDEARKHILKAAGQQFEAGDVRHWWHEDTGLGIRTNISDDLMFLPLAAAEYAMITDDYSIFDELCPYVTGQEIKEGTHSAFGKAYFTEKKDTLYEHCRRACHRAIRYGEHMLPLIGTGDWNDGFDRVGSHGKGESVWLAFFFGYVLKRFREIALMKNDESEVRFIDENIRLLTEGVRKSAWDGKWYRRAYNDNGEPLGSAASEECKTDLVVQAWAAIAGMTDESEIKTALESAKELLIDRENGVVKLFAPPFEGKSSDAGYISSYKKGVRENGGQYTHAAIWFALALAETGDREGAYEVIRMLDPIRKTSDPEGVLKYKAEPYVMAADVYLSGMGGWTWYTGSAGWMYKVILENILGIKIRGEKLIIEPAASEKLLPYRVNYERKTNNTSTPITVDVLTSDKARIVTLDGKTVPDGKITLPSDGLPHKIVIAQENHSHELWAQV